MMSAELFVEGFAQDQSLFGLRKRRKCVPQPRRKAADFSREDGRVRRIGYLLNERERLIDPVWSRHDSRAQEHQPLAARRRGGGFEPCSKGFIRHEKPASRDIGHLLGFIARTTI